MHPTDQISRIVSTFAETTDADEPPLTSQVGRDIEAACKSGATAATLEIGLDEGISDFRSKLSRLLLIADVVVAKNNPVALSSSPSRFQRQVKHLGGGWMPEPYATDANRHEDTYQVTMYNRQVLSECRRCARAGVPIVYLPTTEAMTFTTWDVSLYREGFDSENAWSEAGRRSRLFSDSALPSLPSERLLRESPDFIGQRPPVLEFQLPALDGLPPEEVQQAIADHPDAYWRFRMELRKILDATRSAHSRGDEREVEAIRSNLHDEVIRLNQQYGRMRKTARRAVAADGVTLACFSILALTTQDLVQVLTGAGALYKARGVVDSYLQYEAERLRMEEESRLFWFWNLLREQSIPMSGLRLPVAGSDVRDEALLRHEDS